MLAPDTIQEKETHKTDRKEQSTTGPRIVIPEQRGKAQRALPYCLSVTIQGPVS